MVIGKVLTIDELMNDYGFEAVYVASGAGLPRFMGIPGESLNGVYSANEYLCLLYTSASSPKRRRRCAASFWTICTAVQRCMNPTAHTTWKSTARSLPLWIRPSTSG